MSDSITYIHAGSAHLGPQVREVWRYRELLGFLAWRDVRVRYAQTAVGFVWAFLEPLAAALLFTFAFHRVAGLSAGATPYPIWAFAGLLVWTFFGRVLRDASASIVTNAALLRKVYFPRLILPCSVILAGLVDLACASLTFVVLSLVYGSSAGALATAPLWIALAAMAALGAGLLLASINVWFRDVTQAMPFLLQVWLLATPVAYPLTAVPEAWRPLLLANPMTGAVEGLRWALLEGYPLATDAVCVAAVGAPLLLAIGALVFTRVQRQFADVV